MNIKSCTALIVSFVSVQALALVEEETRRYRPTKNYLENVLPTTLSMTAFETPLMKAEFDRVASRSPMDTLSMKRYVSNFFVQNGIAQM